MRKIGYFSPLGYIALGYAIADRKSFIVDTINDEMVHDNHLMIAIFPYTTNGIVFDRLNQRTVKLLPRPQGRRKINTPLLPAY